MSYEVRFDLGHSIRVLEGYITFELLDKTINSIKDVDIAVDFVETVFDGRWDNRPVKALYNGGEHIFENSSYMYKTPYERMKYIIQEFMLDTGYEEVIPAYDYDGHYWHGVDYNPKNMVYYSCEGYNEIVMERLEEFCKSYSISLSGKYYKNKMLFGKNWGQDGLWVLMNYLISWCYLCLSMDWHDSTMTDDEYIVVGSSNGYVGSNYNIFMRTTYGDNKKRRNKR